MAKDLFARYVWLVDTIMRHGRITRANIDSLWIKSAFSDGRKMPRRTFYNYRAAIEELFDINIECDQATFEYYIEENNARQESVTNWLLNSTATNEMVTASRDIADRVFLEEVPSAREYLPIVMAALRSNSILKFTYHSYTRSLPAKDVRIEPYFTKIFKQRWYVVGRNIKEDKIKTYALDRMSQVLQLSDTFIMPKDFSPENYFTDAFGIVVDKGAPKEIKLKVESTQAKYFRALPLHHSQEEMVGDSFSVFRYKMRITQDLVAELLSYGPRITVLSPLELRTIIKDSLQRTLANYK